MVIDFLIFPPLDQYLQSTFTKPERSDPYLRIAEMTRPKSLESRSLEDMFGEMDAAKIDRALVRARVTAPRRDFAKAGVTLPSESVTNDQILDWVGRYPERFVGIGTIGPDDLGNVEAVLRQIASEPSLHGLFLNPGQWPVPLVADDRRLYPIYDRCQALDLSVVVLVGANSGPDMTYNSPAAVDIVAADFPRLTLVMAHGGYPWIEQALHVAFRRSNVYLAPDMYFFGFPGWRDYADAANGFLADRFIFSSSYPFLPMEGTVHRARELFSDKVLHKVMGENAARALKFS